jgi:hypothetical protein
MSLAMISGFVSSPMSMIRAKPNGANPCRHASTLAVVEPVLMEAVHHYEAADGPRPARVGRG